MTTAIHPDFPDYVIHADGTVVSMVKSPPRPLRGGRMGNYWGLFLRHADGHIRSVYRHRIVLEIFHGPCPPGHEARHLDGDRTNNAADNLAWGTPVENARDKERHGTVSKGERNGMAKLTEDEVREMRRLRTAGASLTNLIARFGVTRMTCWRATAGRTWTHVKDI